MYAVLHCNSIKTEFTLNLLKYDITLIIVLLIILLTTKRKKRGLNSNFSWRATILDLIIRKCDPVSNITYGNKILRFFQLNINHGTNYLFQKFLEHILPYIILQFLRDKVKILFSIIVIFCARKKEKGGKKQLLLIYLVHMKNIPR